MHLVRHASLGMSSMERHAMNALVDHGATEQRIVLHAKRIIHQEDA